MLDITVSVSVLVSLECAASDALSLPLATPRSRQSTMQRHLAAALRKLTAGAPALSADHRCQLSELASELEKHIVDDAPAAALDAES